MASLRAVSLTTLAIGVLVALSGCANASQPGDSAPSSEPDSRPATTPESGTWTSDDGSAWLTLGDDEVTGNDGCNAVNGTYTIDGDTVAFAMGIMTLKACPGVSLSFRTLASGVIEDERMTLYDAAGTVLATFGRE